MGDTADPVTTSERIEQYLAACRNVYEGLRGPHLSALQSLKPSEDMVGERNITVPVVPVPVSVAKLHCSNDASECLHESNRHWKTEAELLEDHPDAAEMLSGGFRPIRDIVVGVSEILGAFVGKSP